MRGGSKEEHAAADAGDSSMLDIQLTLQQTLRHFEQVGNKVDCDEKIAANPAVFLV